MLTNGWGYGFFFYMFLVCAPGVFIFNIISVGMFYKRFFKYKELYKVALENKSKYI